MNMVLSNQRGCSAHGLKPWEKWESFPTPRRRSPPPAHHMGNTAPALVPCSFACGPRSVKKIPHSFLRNEGMYGRQLSDRMMVLSLGTNAWDSSEPAQKTVSPARVWSPAEGPAVQAEICWETRSVMEEHGPPPLGAHT